MIAFLWIVLSVVVGAVAGKKGRTGVGWFLLALVTSPLIAGVILLLVGDYAPELQRRALANGTMRKCNACAELVQRDAVKCKHCGSELPPYEPPPGPQYY